MAFILVNQTSQPKVGNPSRFWILRENYWDKKIKAQKQRYVCYIGMEPILSESKAKEISEKKGVPLDELRKVTNLSVVSDCEFELRRLARRAAQKDARRLAKAAKAATA